MRQRRTQDDVASFMQGYGYSLLSEYVTSNSKVQIQCPVGHIYEQRFSNFKSGNRCPYCDKYNRAKKHSKNKYQLLRELCNSKSIDPIDIDSYVRNDVGVFFQCHVCLHEYRVTVNWIKKSVTGCPHCDAFEERIKG